MIRKLANNRGRNRRVRDNRGRAMLASAWVNACVTVILLMSIFVLLAACAGNAADDGKISVIYTVNAFGELAKEIGGDLISARSIIPDGVEIHDFEPTAKDLLSLRDADLIIYSGLMDQTWIDKLTTEPGKDRSPLFVDLSAGVTTIELPDGGVDPHFWLSPAKLTSGADVVKNALIAIDNTHSGDYTARDAAFRDKLQKIVSEYSEQLANARGHTIVTAHAAFGYLCQDFGLTQKSIRGVFAEGEPSARELAALVDFCRDEGISVIFMEYGEESSVSGTLASEIGAVTLPLYTMEAAEDGTSCLERINYNLSTILSSLS